MLKIEHLEYTEDVYDITVEKNENFYANGILVHNCEITLPTKPLNDINDPDGEISLCTLAAINWGKIRDPTDFERPCTLAVRALDELLDYQDYPVLAAKNSTMARRPLGVGIINLAYWLARNDLSYQHIDNDGLSKLHAFAEAWSYYLIKASVDLAEEKGACPKSNETKYSQGAFPIHTYKRELDEIVSPEYRMDWVSLGNKVQSVGIRNSTLMALMPSECQSLNNELLLSDGKKITLSELIANNINITLDEVHSNVFPGQRFQFNKPVEFANGDRAYECYWNGYKHVTEIEFEDGNTYRFTENHQLLVDRNGTQMFVVVSNLRESDDIVSF